MDADRPGAGAVVKPRSDVFDAAKRAAVMAAVKGADTKPEMTVRRLCHALGYRYRLHRRDLPGRPDLAFGPRKKAVFVHGCFWHGHDCARGARVPKANRDYWTLKIARNRARDEAALAELEKRGWRTLVIWECEMKDRVALGARLAAFLEGEKA